MSRVLILSVLRIGKCYRTKTKVKFPFTVINRCGIFEVVKEQITVVSPNFVNS